MKEHLVVKHDFDYVINKLWHTINTYRNKYQDLDLLADFIRHLDPEKHTTYSFLNEICTYSDELGRKSYVIRFLHYRLEREMQDFRHHMFVQDKYPFYLEFPDAE